jgi:uncharacterized membrane protein YqhA
LTKIFFEKSIYLNFIAALVLLVTSILALLWGAVKAIKVWSLMTSSLGQDSTISLGMIQLVDTFLIAVVLYLFAVSVYELFVGDLALPEWMVVHSLDELKVKLGSVIVLVLAVRFMEHLFEEHTAPLDVVYYAIATALVAAVLIAFGYFTERAKH